MNDKLLKAIKARNAHKTEFNYGVLTADCYVQTLQECVGLDVCNRFTSKSGRSFEDLMQKAAKTLVYSNPDMEVEKKRVGNKLRGVELPKNTLMVFQHVLTSTRKDRDGDILRSDGAEVDPSMLLLWQHVSTLPIGKMIKVSSQNKKSLKIISAIVDINKLSHDAAVMIDNGMGRFSHGFRALEFEPMKDKDGETEGFDVKSFEIMEESLVSVPSNVDAETEEVLLSLVEDGKLTSPLMKQVGKGLRARRNLVVPVGGVLYRESVGDVARELNCSSFAELKEAADAGLIGVQKDDDDKTGEGTETSLAKEANGKEKETGTEESGDEEVKWVDESIEGSWEWKRDILQDGFKSFAFTVGLELGERDYVYVQGLFDNYAIVCIRSSKDAYYKADWEMQKGVPTWKGEPRSVDIVVSVETKKQAKQNVENASAEKLMADFLSVATVWERERMVGALEAMTESEKQKKITEQYRDMIGTKE